MNRPKLRLLLLVLGWLASCGETAFDAPGMTGPLDGGVDAAVDGAAVSPCTIPCPTGQLCCTAPAACAGSCVLDCRTAGCYQNAVCNATTGLCIPGSGGSGGMG